MKSQTCSISKSSVNKSLWKNYEKCAIPKIVRKLQYKKNKKHEKNRFFWKICPDHFQLIKSLFNKLDAMKFR